MIHDFTIIPFTSVPQWIISCSCTLVQKSFDYQFIATLDRGGQGIQNNGDDKRGENGIPMLLELSVP